MFFVNVNVQSFIKGVVNCQMWALCCDTKGCATVGLWKQLTSSILTVRAFPANTAHSPNVDLLSANVADVGLTLKQHWANFSLK